MNISKYLNVQGAEFDTKIVNLTFLIIMAMPEDLNFPNHWMEKNTNSKLCFNLISSQARVFFLCVYLKTSTTFIIHILWE